ncbi:MAG: single-stranded-DNA-specific exonuclease RecJ [Clostridiales bacterium]|nr:single-stranded-DNA-specific exonuclease RecJ [Clostridiales bacterium]
MIHFVRRGQTAERMPEGYPPFQAAFLASRGLDTPGKIADFFDTGKERLSDPRALPGTDEAVSILKEAARAGENVIVYGDYDADGVCASAIMYKALASIGIRTGVFLPDRHGEGYGLNRAAVEEMARHGKVLVTVDNGITAVEEVALARELGMKVVVTDHHHPHEVLPDADAVICPLAGEGYPYTDYCGAALAWQLARALTGDEKAWEWLDLCALATFADMVPLAGENRVIAYHGLRAIGHTKNPGLKALIEVSSLQPPLNARDVSFTLAPRINACGRMDSAGIALRLLTEENEAAARELAVRTQGLNDSRREQEALLIEQTHQMLKDYDLVKDHAIVLWNRGWDIGVVGLAAGKIAEETGYPAVILSDDGEKMTGSARSAGGIDIHEALSECADLFIRFGGHKQAAGMTLASSNGEAFRKRLCEAVDRQLAGRALAPVYEYDTEMELSDVTLENIGWLRKMEPFGTGNPDPVFLVRRARVQTMRPVGNAGQHLKCTFVQGETTRGGIAFSMAKDRDDIGEYADLLIMPQVNEYKGVRSPDMRITAMRPAHCLPQQEYADTDALLQDLLLLSRIEMDNRGERAETAPLSGLLEDTAHRAGTAVLCRTRQTAEKLLARLEPVDVCFREAADSRAYFALLYACPAERITAPYSTVILADGETAPGEAGMLERMTGAKILCAPRSGELSRELDGLKPGMDSLRELYKCCRQGENALEVMAVRCGITPRQALCGLYILREAGYISFTFSPFSVSFISSKGMNPADVPLYELIDFTKEG